MSVRGDLYFGLPFLWPYSGVHEIYNNQQKQKKPTEFFVMFQLCLKKKI